jgi:MFS family permease
LGLLAVAPSTPSIVASILLLAIGFRSFAPVTQAYLMDSFPEESMGGDLGAVRTVWGVIASLGTTYVGLVAGWWSYTAAYVGLIGCLGVSLALFGLLRFGRS